VGRERFSKKVSRHGAGVCLTIALCLLLGPLGAVSLGADQDVINTGDSGVGSLRQGVADVGAGENVIFQPAVAGQTINLSSHLNVLRSMDFVNSSTGNVAVDFNGNAMVVTGGSIISLDSGLTLQTATTGATDAGTIASIGSYTINGLNGTVTAQSVSGRAAGVYGAVDVDITGLSGVVTASSDDGFAAALSAENNLNITGGLSGTVEASTTGDYSDAAGLSASFSGTSVVTIDGNLNGTVTAISTGTSVAASGFRGTTINIAGDLSGTVEARATGSGANATAFNTFGPSLGDVTIGGELNGTVRAISTGIAVGFMVQDIGIAGGISGTVEAESSDSWAFGIRSENVHGLTADDPLVITGTGQILATGASADMLGAIVCNTLNVRVENGGILSAINTGSGEAWAIRSHAIPDGEVELVAGCHIIGDIGLSGSTDTLTLSGDAADSTTLDGAISGAEQMNATGGTWTLNGAISDVTDPAALAVSGGLVTLTNLNNTYTGGTTVTGGTLMVNGRIVGDTTVGAAGTLGGIGQVFNLVNSGTVAPGNSIGTLTVAGDYTQNPGSTLEIEINDVGGSDLLDISGTATLNGGTVDVQAESGSYATGMTYTFLDADGGVTGTFDGVTDNLPFLTAVLLYGANDVQIFLGSHTPYITVAQTFNQRAVAGYLDNHHAGATGDLNTVMTELDTLTAPNARAAFDAMSGELYGSLSTVGIENTNRFLWTIAARLRSRSLNRGLAISNHYASTYTQSSWSDSDMIVRGQSPRGRFGWLSSSWDSWAEGYGVGANIVGNGNASGLGYSTGGVAFGLERRLDRCTLAGVAGGYSNTGVTLDQRGDRATIDSAQVGVYLHRDINQGYATGIATYGHNGYDTRRHVTIGTIQRLATANYGGNEFSFYAETGRNYYLGRVHLQPHAALQYIQLHQNGFIESDAQSVDLSVGGVHADSFRGLLGTRLVSYFQTDSGRLLSLEGRALWRHEFLDEARVLDATFAGQPGGAFTVDGVNVDRDAAILGAGLTFHLSTGWKLHANYDILTSANYTAHAGTGGLTFVW